MVDYDKVKTYVNFAIRSRKIVFGTDNILKQPKSKIIIVSSLLSKLAIEKLESFAITHKIKLFKIDGEKFLSIVNKERIKAAAILDDNLADARKINLTII